jgi:hypothetical protein
MDGRVRHRRAVKFHFRLRCQSQQAKYAGLYTRTVTSGRIKRCCVQCTSDHAVCYVQYRGSVDGTATASSARRPGVRFPIQASDFSPKHQHRASAQPTLHSMCSRRQNSRSVILTTHLRLSPRLRMSGAIPLLSLHPFMTLTRTIIP